MTTVPHETSTLRPALCYEESLYAANPEGMARHHYGVCAENWNPYVAGSAQHSAYEKEFYRLESRFDAQPF